MQAHAVNAGVSRVDVDVASTPVAATMNSSIMFFSP